jgi:hypothetical protein
MPRTSRVCTDLARRCAIVVGTALLASACGNLETHTLRVQTAAEGTQIEAKELVAFVYAQASDAELDKILYSYGDLWLAAKRLRERYPQLKPWLDQGTIGNTVGGFMAVRDETQRERLRDLLWQENLDRSLLHTGTSVAVGHGSDDLKNWLPYASAAFGSEWIAQGQPGWWWLDDDGQWHRK